MCGAGAHWRLLAENLASVTTPRSDIGRKTIAVWLASPGHRSALLAPAFTHTGAGLAVDAFGTWYVVQLYMVPESCVPRAGKCVSR